MKNKRKTRVTRRDVAEADGVSETIVSYVMNGNRYVKEEKRQRVLEAVERLNYQPNHLARSLKMQKSRHLLFLTDDLRSEHFGDVMDAMETILFSENYLISLSRYRTDSGYINDLIARQFDGVFISSSSLDTDTLKQLSRAGVATVMVQRNSIDEVPENCAIINSGLYRGEKLLLDHLYASGCRRILFANRSVSDQNETFWEDPRVTAYEDFCREKNLETLIMAPSPSDEEFRSRLKGCLSGKERPDAISAFNDRTAVEVLRITKELGINVPGDLAVSGFDNTKLSEYISPSLTTISVDRRDMAQKMLDTMFELIETGKAEDQSCNIKLIKRESTGI